MFYQTATDLPLSGLIATPALSVPVTGGDFFESETMLNPKWAVLAVALAVFALAASYDADLGLAVGVVLVVIISMALWVRVRFAMQPGKSNADRYTLSKRFKRLGRNRRAAQAASELGPQTRTDPRKRP